VKSGLVVACAVLLGACEVIAGFDRDRLEEQRTIGPTPLPNADGAVALTPDAGALDGALIGPGRDEAGVLDAAAEADAGDAAVPAVADAAGIDAEVIAEEPDATIVDELSN
jgi:hypothetical protein